MSESIEERIRAAAEQAGASAFAVAADDLGAERELRIEADRWFHAASTIKLAVLVAMYDAIESDGLPTEARVHVRNQFVSLADGRYYQVDAGRDGNESVHGYIGRTMRMRDLAHHMIVTSSNLATNVLVELLGPERIRATLDRLGVDGIEFRRGVEDERAWEAGINNRVTATGLLTLLRRVAEGERFDASSVDEMLEILHAQQFVSGIPAGLPEGARVANKTGEISTVVHDAGIVYLPDRDPYVLVVLTEWEQNGDVSNRRRLIADVSRVVHEELSRAGHG